MRAGQRSGPGKEPLFLRLILLDILTRVALGMTGAMFLYFEHRLGFAARGRFTRTPDSLSGYLVPSDRAPDATSASDA